MLVWRSCRCMYITFGRYPLRLTYWSPIVCVFCLLAIVKHACSVGAAKEDWYRPHICVFATCPGKGLRLWGFISFVMCLLLLCVCFLLWPHKYNRMHERNWGLALPVLFLGCFPSSCKAICFAVPLQQLCICLGKSAWLILKDEFIDMIGYIMVKNQPCWHSPCGTGTGWNYLDTRWSSRSDARRVTLISCVRFWRMRSRRLGCFA